jgi:hypothetical protein
MRTVRDRGPHVKSVSSNNRAGVVILLAVVLGAGAVLGRGHTLWQDGGVQLCGNSAESPMLAVSDSAGGAIVVWTDTRQSLDGIYAQRVDASGVPLWTENGVLLCDSTVQTLNFGAVDDGRHGVIAVWAPYWHTFAVQRVSAEGVPLWGPNGLTLRPEVDSLVKTPALVNDGHGGAIVVWRAFEPSGAQDTLIACRVDSSGVKKWETVFRIDTMCGMPCLCEDGLGGAIIAWSDYSRRVRVQRVDSAGAIKWVSGGVLACTLSAAQGATACVSVSESCFVVGLHVVTDSFQQIRAQMLDLAGNRRWGLAGVPVTGTSSSSWGDVGLSTGDRRQSVWLWSENRTATDCFFAQKLDSAGARCWDSTGVWLGTSDTSDWGCLSAASDGQGGAIAAWSLYRSRLNWDIYAQHMDSSGRLCWSDTGLAVCPGDNNVTSPVAVSDGDGGAIIAWKGDLGIYAQRVADGAGVEEVIGDERRAMSNVRTVVRGVLILAEASSHKPQVASLLDAAGRKVAMLHEGANDVGALAPGVYFVREEPQAASHKLFAKVVVTR